jgi:tRNA uridine 5-carboxymethylaminomethyl modification enzyme
MVGEGLVEPMDYPNIFDVIVIGGGHAGTEAALASARIPSYTFPCARTVADIVQSFPRPDMPLDKLQTF